MSKSEFTILIDLVNTELARVKDYTEDLKKLLQNLYDARDTATS